MKKFVLVAIGGTGMRVAQSFVALAAAGFLIMAGHVACIGKTMIS